MGGVFRLEDPFFPVRVKSGGLEFFSSIGMFLSGKRSFGEFIGRIWCLPNCGMRETKDAYVVSMEFSAIPKESINVNI